MTDEYRKMTPSSLSNVRVFCKSSSNTDSAQIFRETFRENEKGLPDSVQKAAQSKEALFRMPFHTIISCFCTPINKRAARAASGS
jgi:hypothetical protein